MKVNLEDERKRDFSSAKVTKTLHSAAFYGSFALDPLFSNIIWIVQYTVSMRDTALLGGWHGPQGVSGIR